MTASEIKIFKEKIENQTIRTVSIEQNTEAEIIAVTIELNNGDQVVLENAIDRINAKIDNARDIEIEEIKRQISGMKLEEKKTILLKHIEVDNLRSVATKRATALGHPNPANVVLASGSRCVVNFATQV